MSIEDGTVSDMELDEAEDEVIEEEFEEEEVPGETPKESPPIAPGAFPPYGEGSHIKLRDLREYIVIKSMSEGIVVAELEPDFSKFAPLFFWRSEAIAELKKKNRILEVK